MELNAKVLKLINDYLSQEPPHLMAINGRQVRVKIMSLAPTENEDPGSFDVVIELSPDMYTTYAVEYRIGLTIGGHIHNIIANMFGINDVDKVNIKVHHPRIQ